MIELTRLNKKKFWLNHELIESVEATPDTVVTLVGGKLLIVTDPPEQIARKVLEYRQAQYGVVLAGVISGTAPDLSRQPQPENGIV